MTASHAHGAPAALLTGKSTPAWRLLATLGFGGAFAGALIANVYERTLPAIRAAADARIQGAVQSVLGAPARLDTLYLVGEALSRTPPSGKELRDVTKVFVGLDADGTRLGVAVEAAAPGFADDVRLMVGFDPATSALTGFAVLGQKETPGLGDKIEKDTAFNARFIGKVAPLTGTKQSTTEASMVQTITGATISSRAVIEIINGAIATWQPRLAALKPDGAP
ncbi:MAG: FMN-binding protein [Gemmatimonadales bacterium]|nr:FMN-binding protein [Gemmatimonadales bacterium]